MQRPRRGLRVRDHWDIIVEVSARPGVTDPVALTAREALGVCLPAGVPAEARIQTAVQYLVAAAPGASLDAGRACAVLPQPAHPERRLHHPRAVGARRAAPGRITRTTFAASPGTVAVIDLAGLSDSELADAFTRSACLRSPWTR